MPRRRSNRKASTSESLVKMSIGLLCLAALAIGGLKNFGSALLMLVIAIAAVGLLGVLSYVLVQRLRARSTKTSVNSESDTSAWTTTSPPSGPSLAVPQVTTPIQPDLTVIDGSWSAHPTALEQPRETWTQKRIAKALADLDWYQFEKFCAELLRREGYQVDRKGGAKADGGVDLIAVKDGQTFLIQCKHWRTWKVKENVIRELLGSMTHYKATHGTLLTLIGATIPAETFGSSHSIEITDATDLARRAHNRFSESELSSYLEEPMHLCPKCDSPMVWRTGNFDPFHGCSKYPRCRGVIRDTTSGTRAVQS